MGVSCVVQLVGVGALGEKLDGNAVPGHLVSIRQAALNELDNHLRVHRSAEAHVTYDKGAAALGTV